MLGTADSSDEDDDNEDDNHMKLDNSKPISGDDLGDSFTDDSIRKKKGWVDEIYEKEGRKIGDDAAASDDEESDDEPSSSDEQYPRAVLYHHRKIAEHVHKLYELGYKTLIKGSAVGMEKMVKKKNKSKPQALSAIYNPKKSGESSSHQKNSKSSTTHVSYGTR